MLKWHPSLDLAPRIFVVFASTKENGATVVRNTLDLIGKVITYIEENFEPVPVRSLLWDVTAVNLYREALAEAALARSLLSARVWGCVVWSRSGTVRELSEQQKQECL